MSLLCACGKKGGSGVEENKKIKEEGAKIYHLKVEDAGERFLPSIYLDPKTKTFSFTYSLLSSYLPYGTYEITDGILVMKTVEDAECYQFEVVDDHTLKYLEESSTAIHQYDEKIEYPLEDGALFELYVPTLLEGASPETSAMALWKYDGTATTWSWLYDAEKEKEILKKLQKITLGEIVDTIDTSTLSGPIYGLEISRENGGDAKVAWWDGYCFTEKGIYQVDIDFQAIESEYKWTDKDTMDLTAFPNFYQIVKQNGIWNKKLLVESEVEESQELSLTVVSVKDSIITAKIKNKSSTEASYGEYFTIQVELDGTWYAIPTEYSMAFNDIAYLIQAGEETDREYNLSAYGGLPAGTYRLVVEGATAEFQVEEP